MMTLRQYAEAQSITYEAVRKQVSRYTEELKDHIVKKNRVQYLDDWAIQFLTERRRERPIVQIGEELSAEVESLKAEVESLKTKLMTAQTELLKDKDRIIELQESANKAIEDRTKYNLLLEESAAKDQKLKEKESIIEDLEKKTDELQRERDEAQAEAGSYQKSFFGLYRKVTTKEGG